MGQIVCLYDTALYLSLSVSLSTTVSVVVSRGQSFSGQSFSKHLILVRICQSIGALVGPSRPKTVSVRVVSLVSRILAPSFQTKFEDFSLGVKLSLSVQSCQNVLSSLKISQQPSTGPVSQSVSLSVCVSVSLCVSLWSVIMSVSV